MPEPANMVFLGKRTKLGLGALGFAVLTLAASAQGQPAAKPSAAPTSAPNTKTAPVPSTKLPTPANSATPMASAAQSGPSAAPPGHPQVEEDDDDDEPHAAPPHGDPGHGAHGAGRSGMGFEPTPDAVEPDPTLAPGTIVISVRNAEDIPLAGVNLTLGILHNSVAKGESRDRQEAKTDESGEAVVTGLQYGGGHTYRVSSTVGPGTFDVQPFSLTDKAGMRVTLHLYEVTEDLSRVRVAMRSTLSVSLKEDAMVVDVTYNVFNVSPSAWQADVEVPLPAGFKAFNTAEDMAQSSLKVLPTATGAVLRGTVPPGQSDVGFRYNIALSGQEAQDIEFSLFPHTLQTQLAVEASRKMRLVAEGFPPAQPSHTQDGRSFLYTTRGLQAGPLEHFKATVGGLPTRGPGGYIAVGLAILAIFSALLYRALRIGRTEVPDDTYQDLVEARETLLEEIQVLERAHESGRMGPKTYARARSLLTEALARIITQIDAAEATRTIRVKPSTTVSGGGSSSKSGGSRANPSASKPRKKRPQEASL